jgi:hypothetical protein
MRNILRHIILLLIQLIEFVEYRNLSLDEDDIDKKILYTLDLDGYEILTDTGWSKFQGIKKFQGNGYN